MKTGTVLFLLCIFNIGGIHAILASFNPISRAIPTSRQLLKEEFIVQSSGMTNDLRSPGRNFYGSSESVDNAPSLIKSSSPHATTTAAHQTTPTEVKKIKEDYMPPKNKRRSLVLVRRGFFGGVGSSLLSASDVLAKKGNNLQRFDELTAHEKLRWVGRKTKNGMKHTVSFAVKIVVLPIKAVAFVGKHTFRGAKVAWRGTGRAITKAGKVVGKGVLLAGYLVYKAGSETLKFINRVARRSWKYFGKGLAAAGRGLQKAGDGMQAQTATRLPKKIKTPPTEELAPQFKPEVDHTIKLSRSDDTQGLNDCATETVIKAA